MSYNWKLTTWGELATLEYGKGLSGYEKVNGDYPVYGTNGMIGWHTEPLFEKAGVIIGRKGAYRGVHYSKTPFYVIDTAFYLKPKIDIDLRWAYYQLLTLDLNSMDSGSAIPSTSRPDFYALPVVLPPLPEQYAIGGILGALDDKIELNRRMNRTLESIAGAVFRQWFVENEEVQGWKVGKLAEICKTQYGYTASASDEPIGPKFLRITDMNKEPWIDWKSVPHCEIKNDEFGKYKLEMGDILVSRMADPGKVGIVEEEIQAVFASYLVRLKFTNLPWSYFAFYFLGSNQYLEYAESVKSGSVQSGMNAKVIAGVELRIPPVAKVQEFFTVIKPFRDLIIANLQESRTLANLRDSLLPKLMKGEVRIQS